MNDQKIIQGIFEILTKDEDLTDVPYDRIRKLAVEIAVYVANSERAEAMGPVIGRSYVRNILKAERLEREANVAMERGFVLNALQLNIEAEELRLQSNLSE